MIMIMSKRSWGKKEWLEKEAFAQFAKAKLKESLKYFSAVQTNMVGLSLTSF